MPPAPRHRVCAPFVLALVASWAEPAAAEGEPASDSSPAAEINGRAGADAARPHRRLGAMLDVGVPDGAMAALVVRPWQSLQLDLGAGHNSVGAGLRAGATVAPFDWTVGPTLRVAVGHYFAGDVNAAARLLTGDDGIDRPLLRDVAYDFANAHLGIDFGRERFTFFVRAGLSYVRSPVRNLQEELAQANPDQNPEMPTVRLDSDPVLTVIGTSAQLGFILYL